MTLDQAKEFVVQEKRDAKARLVINDELSSVCHCCTALKYRCKSLYGFAFENTNFPYLLSENPWLLTKMCSCPQLYGKFLSLNSLDCTRNNIVLRFICSPLA